MRDIFARFLEALFRVLPKELKFKVVEAVLEEGERSLERGNLADCDDCDYQRNQQENHGADEDRNK